MCRTNVISKCLYKRSGNLYWFLRWPGDQWCRKDYFAGEHYHVWTNSRYTMWRHSVSRQQGWNPWRPVLGVITNGCSKHLQYCAICPLSLPIWPWVKRLLFGTCLLQWVYTALQPIVIQSLFLDLSVAGELSPSVQRSYYTTPPYTLMLQHLSMGMLWSTS